MAPTEGTPIAKAVDAVLQHDAVLTWERQHRRKLETASVVDLHDIGYARGFLDALKKIAGLPDRETNDEGD